jgi:hypothetical protein
LLGLENLKVSIPGIKVYEIRIRCIENSKLGIMFTSIVKSRKSSLKLGSCAKLAPRYCGPFEILDRIGIIAYRLAFPANIKSQMFSMFLFLRNMYMILTM